MTDPTIDPTIDEIIDGTIPGTDAGTETESVADTVAPVTMAGRPRRRLPRLALRRTGGGISAVGVKELRGRMRGRRAFIILTLYLLLLGGFAWMVEVLMERSLVSGFGNSGAYASATIGQGIFAALLMLETLQVVFLAPAATAGAISLEREKQTLDMLIATPISSLAIVVGKLLSALTYVFLLIAASIPLTAVVFVYGGVGPEDVIRGYAVLLATALGLGAFGLFCSSLVKRTQAATAISIFGVLSVTIGSLFLLIFWVGIANSGGNFQGGLGPIKGRPPEVIAYVNPFLAQADVMCGTETSYGAWCSITTSLVPPQNGVIFNDVQPRPMPANVDMVRPVGGVPIIAGDIVPFGVTRDAFWPKSVLTWLILSVIFLALSIQLVSPTRRWRPRRPRRAPAEVAA